jgi:copper(I)-binding protein
VIANSRRLLSLRGFVVLAAAALLPGIAGCEAGMNAPTQRWHQPTAGTSAVVNNAIRINNLFVLGPPVGSSIGAGGAAGMFFSLANDGGADRLLTISAPGAASLVRLPHGGISLAAQQSVLLTGPVPKVVLENLTRSLAGGQVIRVVLNFQNAGSVTLSVPVMPLADFYSTYSAPPVVASPSPTPTTSVTPAPSSSLTPSPTPTQ